MTPVPTPSVTPVFTSDEEALAAAEESYKRYLAVSDGASSGGWVKPELLAPFTTAGELERTKITFAELAETGRHTQGESTFDSMILQHRDDLEVAVYVCLDVSGVRLLDSTGIDVTPADRPNRLPLEIVFQIAPDERLMLDTSDLWAGGGICE